MVVSITIMKDKKQPMRMNNQQYLDLKRQQKQQNHSQNRKNPTQNQKKRFCKQTVTSELGKRTEKHGNYARKSIGNVNKGGTFAPATTKNVH